MTVRTINKILSSSVVIPVALLIVVGLSTGAVCNLCALPALVGVFQLLAGCSGSVVLRLLLL